MTYTVDRCADCPMFKPNRSWAESGFGKCRINESKTYGKGNPPPTCPLRDSAVTIVIREGR